MRIISFAKIVIIFLTFFLFIEIKTLKDENILKNLIEINEEMNKKYNSYDHFSKLKCNDDLNIIEIEKKIRIFFN